jgi:hypothetical protein
MDQTQPTRILRSGAHRRTMAASLRRSVTPVVWASLAATRLVFADPAPNNAKSCVAASPQEATALADRLYEGGQYQRAGECYDAAGDSTRAQRAFLRAAGPSAEAAARGLKDESHTAKALFAQVQQAFRSNH